MVNRDMGPRVIAMWRMVLRRVRDITGERIPLYVYLDSRVFWEDPVMSSDPILGEFTENANRIYFRRHVLSCLGHTTLLTASERAVIQAYMERCKKCPQQVKRQKTPVKTVRGVKTTYTSCTIVDDSDDDDDNFSTVSSDSEAQPGPSGASNATASKSTNGQQLSGSHWVALVDKRPRECIDVDNSTDVVVTRDMATASKGTGEMNGSTSAEGSEERRRMNRSCSEGAPQRPASVMKLVADSTGCSAEVNNNQNKNLLNGNPDASPAGRKRQHEANVEEVEAEECTNGVENCFVDLTNPTVKQILFERFRKGHDIQSMIPKMRRLNELIEIRNVNPREMLQLVVEHRDIAKIEDELKRRAAKQTSAKKKSPLKL